jgi:single-strand DNA-binding protein
MNNSLVLIGHVGGDPETVHVNGDKKVVKFSIAVKEFTINKEVPPKTMWVDVEAWNGVGDLVLSTITKRREVVLNGRLAISKYTTTDKNGSDREVVKPIMKLSSFYLTGKETKERKEAKAQAEANETKEHRVTRAKAGATAK